MSLIEPLPWDSSFFGINIARVREDVDPSEIEAVAAEADARAIDCVYLLAAAERTELTGAAQLHGFRVIDVRVTFGRPVEGHPASLDGLRRIKADELNALETIARERFDFTRFTADLHFDRGRARELYVAWLRRGLEADGDRVVLASTNSPGFVLCHLDPSGGIGTIELLAVASSAEGQGIGGNLVAGAGALYAQASLATATVVTQGRNVEAQRLYQRHGYRTTAMQLWLHRWRNES